MVITPQAFAYPIFILIQRSNSVRIIWLGPDRTSWINGSMVVHNVTSLVQVGDMESEVPHHNIKSDQFD
jgi:hypothetical protein